MPMPSALAAAGWSMRDRLAVDQRSRRVQPRSTPNSASSSSRWPWPSSPPRPTTSPGRTDSEMSFSRSVQLTGRGTSSTGAASLPARGGLRRKDVAVFAADHQLDHFVVGLGAGLVGGDVAAVAEHRAFVGELGDLVHAVRDVEERQALAAQALEHREDLGDVGRGQRRGRLVEDQDARLAGQRLGDLDHLPARQRQVLDQRQRMDVLGAGARQRLLGDARAAPRRSIRPKRGRRIADDDVVGDRQVGDQRQFLEDADDAGLVGGGRRGEGHLARRRAACAPRRARRRRP